MQAASEDTTLADHNGEKASSKPEPVDDSLPTADIPAATNPPAVPKITYPGVLVASILNIALLLSLFLVALDLVSFLVIHHRSTFKVLIDSSGHHRHSYPYYHKKIPQ